MYSGRTFTGQDRYSPEFQPTLKEAKPEIESIVQCYSQKSPLYAPLNRMTQPKNRPVVNTKSEDGMRMKPEIPANF
jgi:hypothetical protein